MLCFRLLSMVISTYVLFLRVHYAFVFLHDYICIIQRNRACLTQKNAIEIKSLLSLLLSDLVMNEKFL